MRAPTHKQLAPNPARTAPALGKTTRKTERPRDNPAEIQIQELAASRGRIDAVVDVLDWYFDLLARIRRARLRLELVGLDPIEQDFLEDEGREFRRVCRRLTWGLRRREAA